MPKPIPERRKRKLDERRESCAAACRAVVKSPADEGTKRTALRALVRYATPKGVQRPGDLRTAGVAELDVDAAKAASIDQEHVVPVRVLVERMLAGDDPDDVLGVAVVAHVLTEEHKAIGTLAKRHARLYEQMRTAPLQDLPTLGRRRYEDSKLQLDTVPRAVIPQRLFDE